jgi:hypothetical protein
MARQKTKEGRTFLERKMDMSEPIPTTEGTVPDIPLRDGDTVWSNGVCLTPPLNPVPGFVWNGVGR